MEMLLGIFLGIGLSAACGFRIFVPPLIMSIAALSGHLELAQEIQWMGTYPALIAFGVATSAEILGYYIPWFDNLLDTIAAPAAVLAGTLITASFVGDMNPIMQWTLALIAGGGSAGITQAATSIVRLASTATTGGIGNPVVSTMEAVGALFMSVVAIVLPVLAVIMLIGLTLFVIIKIRKGKHIKNKNN